MSEITMDNSYFIPANPRTGTNRCRPVRHSVRVVGGALAWRGRVPVPHPCAQHRSFVGQDTPRPARRWRPRFALVGLWRSGGTCIPTPSDLGDRQKREATRRVGNARATPTEIPRCLRSPHRGHRTYSDLTVVHGGAFVTVKPS